MITSSRVTWKTVVHLLSDFLIHFFTSEMQQFSLSLFDCFSTSVFMQHIFMGLNHTFISAICHTDWLPSVAWISGEYIRVSMNDISVWQVNLINFGGNEPFVNTCLKTVSRATIERTTERYNINCMIYYLDKNKITFKTPFFEPKIDTLNWPNKQLQCLGSLKNYPAPLNIYCCAHASFSETLTFLFQRHPFPESHAFLLLRMISASRKMNLCNVKFNMPAFACMFASSYAKP